MNILASQAEVLEFGTFEDAGAIGVGVRFRHGEAVRELIVQVPDPTSRVQEGNTMGMYVELDGNAFYGGVLDWKYDDSGGVIRLALNPSKSGGIELLQVELPSPRSATDESTLKKLSWAYESGLSARN